MTHTPGPWTVSTEDLRGGRYYSVSRGPDDGEPIDLHETENGEADARLIAAAPDMLAALQECALQLQYLAEKFQPTGTGEAVYARIQAAIAKATLTAGDGTK